MDIEDTHPLRRLAIYDAVPPLRVFRSCLKKKKPHLREALKTIFLKEMGLAEECHEDDELDHRGDPFLRAGYGMNAFFRLILKLVYMLLCITVFMLPVLWVYSSSPE